jgi:SAM-dependent methyltransferase
MSDKGNRPAEFDAHAKGYAPGMNTFLKRTVGGEFGAFLEAKVLVLRRRLPWAFGEEKSRLLDFGTGTGELLKQLVNAGFRGELTGCDVSGEMLREAEKRWAPGEPLPSLVQSEPGRAPFEDCQFDIVTASCVFHHVPASDRGQLMLELVRVLKPGGVAVIFEHNPINPITQWMVSRSPLDVDTVLLGASETITLMEGAGMRSERAEYFMFFPPRIRILVRLERLLHSIPLGGQYAVFGQKPNT